ncbi:hypothetical protein [Paracoccus laeviglucosivorans]|uniref:Uncharacterized protein n=1 Tax=Paracoccus laeviglucosivorans TaxID=1197861 RepID=A0A521DQG6_9RHOB|nr:hypothetical protein [Paracoccus laeviglucosivorans]SMO73967.1 hypothetical protein SAMN06265221_10943 [Paracoccus laeviglucosivorans]
MKIIAAALAFASLAAPAWADCPEGMQVLFTCGIVERNAQVELCQGDGQIRYTYSADGAIELQFTGPGAGGVKSHVQGIHGNAYASAARRGDMYYAVFIDRDLMNFEGGSDLHSPNPAVVQVYASGDDFNDFKTDKPVARRVCYPPTIEVDDRNFGPG